MSSGRDGGKIIGRPKMGCGESGSYGDLKKKTGEGKYDRDHIPSKAALIKRAKDLCKEHKLEFTEEMAKAVINAGLAIAIPKSAHQTISPTYGGRNTDSIIETDARDPVSAAKRDTEAMSKDLKNHGADERCVEAYNNATEKIKNMSKADFDNLILDAIGSV